MEAISRQHHQIAKAVHQRAKLMDGQLGRMVRSLRRGAMAPCLARAIVQTADGTDIYTDAEQVKAEASRHFSAHFMHPSMMLIEVTMDWLEEYQPHPGPDTIHFRLISAEELDDWLVRTPKGKAPGPSRVSFELLHQSATKFQAYLLVTLTSTGQLWWPNMVQILAKWGLNVRMPAYSDEEDNSILAILKPGWAGTQDARAYKQMYEQGIRTVDDVLEIDRAGCAVLATQVDVFTDGSLMPVKKKQAATMGFAAIFIFQRAGCRPSFAVMSGATSDRLFSSTTAEIMAIAVMLSILPLDTKTTIWCDSQAAIAMMRKMMNAEEDSWHKSLLAYVAQFFVPCIRQHMADLRLRWIPGHKGNEGNKAADKVAKDAQRQRQGWWTFRLGAPWEQPFWVCAGNSIAPYKTGGIVKRQEEAWAATHLVRHVCLANSDADIREADLKELLEALNWEIETQEHYFVCAASHQILGPGVVTDELVPQSAPSRQPNAAPAMAPWADRWILTADMIAQEMVQFGKKGRDWASHGMASDKELKSAVQWQRILRKIAIHMRWQKEYEERWLPRNAAQISKEEASVVKPKKRRALMCQPRLPDVVHEDSMPTYPKEPTAKKMNEYKKLWSINPRFSQ
ncbi:hypothetical protein H4S07_003393 [Coemansia furcata]|uniref:Uncharacterized protein n=1 Tax=Coemansia furcata TaxID=417177 RepID=A0ACC1LIZ0_9FUNG|nr:hypothetical protein H4S07_003393 [Coemansia furcata]